MATDYNKHLPSQRLTYKEKIKDDYKYFRETSNYLISSSSFPSVKMALGGYMDNDEIGMLLGLYNNDIPASWFKHITQPIGDKEFLPAKVRPLNILKSNIDFLWSTYGRRPILATVANNSKEAVQQMIEKEKEYRQTVIRQRYVQILNGQEVESTPEELIDSFKLKYKDAVAAKMQTYLSGVILKYDVKEKFNELFLNYCIHGCPTSLRTIKNNKIVYEPIDCRNLSTGYSHTGYKEDADWAVYLEQMSYSQFADHYYDILDEDLWKQVDEDAPGGVTVRQYFDSVGKDNVVNVYHTVWKGFKKIKMVSFINDRGEPEQKEEDEFYEETKDEYVEEKWIPQLYMTDRVNNDLYLRMHEYSYAISNANSINENKLPYNGITYGYKTTKVFSILKAGISYLTLYLICHLVIEKMLAKHKGKIFLIDYNVVPKVDGWDEEKFIKYMEAMGYAFINRNQPGVDKGMNQYTSIDMSMLGDINQLIALADSYEEKWNVMSGITRQAKGQNFASDQVGTTKASIIQSNITLDYIFQKFDGYTKRELQALLELSKFITLGGYEGVVDKDEYGSELLSIKPGEMLEQLGIKMSDASQELDNLNQAKEYIKSVNQQDPELFIEGLLTNNIGQLKQVIEKIKRKADEAAKGGQQNEMDMKMAMEEAKKELLKFESDLMMERDDNKFANDREIELLKGDIALATAPQINTEVIQDTNNDGRLTAIDISTIAEKSRDRVSKERMNNNQLQVKREEIAAKERMNQDNNKTKLKNPTSGETRKKK